MTAGHHHTAIQLRLAHACAPDMPDEARWTLMHDVARGGRDTWWLLRLKMSRGRRASLADAMLMLDDYEAGRPSPPGGSPLLLCAVVLLLLAIGLVLRFRIGPKKNTT